MLTPRPYQQEFADKVASLPDGSYLGQLATGLGKTYCMRLLYENVRPGRLLILAHRDELVHQPVKFFDCPVGIEMASEHSHGEPVVIASVQSISRRLKRFSPDDFDMIITDECHHSSGQSYRRVYEYFHFHKHIGLTATPNRGDRKRLDDIFQDIIFQRDLRWGIQNGYLTDIYCRRAYIGFDLSAVRTRMGDYAPGELEEAMEGTADAIAQVYREHATGATLIFAVSVHQCNEIAKRIPGAVVVTGETKDRHGIIQGFTEGSVPCIVNCMVFTEGTDIPRVETVIIARPTRSEALYAQMVGRGLRLYPGKDKLNLIDCVGVTGKCSLCTAPTLLGLDLDGLTKKQQDEIEGPIFELPQKIESLSNNPESWVKKLEIVDLWAKENKYDLHGVNWVKNPDGGLFLEIPASKDGTKPGTTFRIPAVDSVGKVTFHGKSMTMQGALDLDYRYLVENRQDCKAVWDRETSQNGRKHPATDKQIRIIKRAYPDMDCSNLTKGQAGAILSKIFRRK